MKSAIVFNIQKFCLHDGDGIRTCVFLKGCPLRCMWCHNPEGLLCHAQRVVTHSLCVHCGECKKVCPSPDKCIGCTKCARNCPVDAISGEIRKPYVIDIAKCIKCGACITNCAFGAIREE